MKNQQNNSWEEQFDKEFRPRSKSEYTGNYRIYLKEIKSFIRQLLEKSRQEGYETGLHEHFHIMDKNMAEFLKSGSKDSEFVLSGRDKKTRKETLEELEKGIDKIARSVFKESNTHEFIDTCDIYILIQKLKNL